MVLTNKQIAILKKACNRSCPLKVMRQLNSAFGGGVLPRRDSMTSSSSSSSESESSPSSETSSGSGNFYNNPDKTIEDIRQSALRSERRHEQRSAERKRRRAEQARAAERARAAPPAPPASRRDVLPFGSPPAAPPASRRDFPPFRSPPAAPPASRRDVLPFRSPPAALPAPPAQSKVGEDRALVELSAKVDSLYDDVANISEHLFKKHLAGLPDVNLNIHSKVWLQKYPDLTGALLSRGQVNEELWNDFFGKFSTAMKEHQNYEKSLVEARYIHKEIEKIFFPTRG